MFVTQLNANEKIVFIDINFIFNNSEAEKLQNEILEKMTKSIMKLINSRLI